MVGIHRRRVAGRNMRRRHAVRGSIVSSGGRVRTRTVRPWRWIRGLVITLRSTSPRRISWVSRMLRRRGLDRRRSTGTRRRCWSVRGWSLLLLRIGGRRRRRVFTGACNISITVPCLVLGGIVASSWIAFPSSFSRPITRTHLDIKLNSLQQSRLALQFFDSRFQAV